MYIIKNKKVYKQKVEEEMSLEKLKFRYNGLNTEKANNIREIERLQVRNAAIDTEMITLKPVYDQLIKI